MKYFFACVTCMLLLFGFTGTANAALVYAESIHDSSEFGISEFSSAGNAPYSSATFPANGLETSDGTGVNLAGISGGVLSPAWDGDYITVHMSAPVPNVSGFDLLVIDTETGNWENKLAEVWVSTDGEFFTSVGNIFGASGNDGSVDFGSFSGDVNYVKLLTNGLPDSHIAINAIIQHPAAVVPLPAAAWLFGSGLLGLVGVARRRNS